VGNSVAWPNGAEIDPLILHGDFELGSRAQTRHIG